MLFFVVFFTHACTIQVFYGDLLKKNYKKIINFVARSQLCLGMGKLCAWHFTVGKKVSFMREVDYLICVAVYEAIFRQNKWV